MIRTAATLAVAVVCLVPGTAGYAQERLAEVIFTNIDGHPTAQVPGVPGEQFRAPTAPFLSLYGSPGGTFWIFKGFTDNPSSDANDVIMVGSGASGLAAAKEGDPSPLPGLNYGFFDSDCGINEGGQYAFGNRLSGGSTATDEVIIKFDGVQQAIAVQEGNSAPGLVDPSGPAGDELFGNSLNSTHILTDGTVAFRADVIQNIDSNFRSALYHGATVLAQEGTTAQSGETYDSFWSSGGSILHSDATGNNWIVEADILPGVGSTEAAVVNDVVEIADGDVIGGFAAEVQAIQAVFMSGSGSWFVRGANSDGTAWVVRDGAVIAASGDPITPGSSELFVSFLVATANSAGDDVIGGVTDNAADQDQVLVLNGDTVVAREGDAVDLDGNGMADDDVFVASFDGNDVFISDDLNDDLIDDRMVYFFGDIRNGAGQPLGDALLRMAVAAPGVLGDLDGDGDVDSADLALLLGSWGPCPGCPADLDGDGDVDSADLALLLGNWG